MTKFFALAVAGSALLAAGSANAASTLNITGLSSVYTGNTGYTADITKTVAPKVDYENVSISPQQITGTLDGKNVSLFAYCVDIYQFSNIGTFNVVSLSSYLNNSAKYNAIASIISSYNANGKTDSATDSAVQLAIWETLYETKSTKDLGSGTFTALDIRDGLSSTNNALVDTKADSIVNAAVNGKINPNITFYVAKNDQKQDLLFWTVLTPPAVPEPATWAMMLMGMGVVGYSMRRRKVEVSFA